MNNNKIEMRDYNKGVFDKMNIIYNCIASKKTNVFNIKDKDSFVDGKERIIYLKRLYSSIGESSLIITVSNEYIAIFESYDNENMEWEDCRNFLLKLPLYLSRALIKCSFLFQKLQGKKRQPSESLLRVVF